jgi:5-methylcytosine-specific restriction endonuclease McrA/DNA-directed RNA polymerase subunit RPC12/RpoP
MGSSSLNLLLPACSGGKMSYLNCLVCGKEVERINANQKYCSDCRIIVLKQQAIQKRANFKKNHPYVLKTFICVICGKHITSKEGFKYCADCRKEYDKNFVKQNPTYYKTYRKQYYAKNKNEIDKKHKEWRTDNPEYFKDYDDDRRFNGNRELVLKRDNYKCQKCDSINSLHIHHIDLSGQSENPNNSLDNLIVLCNICHRKTHHELVGKHYFE